jgi:sirohydrochlorin ferrochelatase
MDAIILFSHGSLLCGSGEALKVHAAALRERGLAPLVEIGYLNYCKPEFSEAVDRCASLGASRIVVVPYFLAPGYFVKVDLPKAVATAQEAHPDLEFTIAEPIGYDERLANALIASAQSARDAKYWRDDLHNAAIHCLADPQCPLFGTPSCPKQPTPIDNLPEPATL